MKTTNLIISLIVAVSFALSGCDEVNETNPYTGQQLKLSVVAIDSMLNVPPDLTEQTAILAELNDIEDSAIVGRLIRFYVDPPTLGNLNSDTGITDQFGQVEKIFTTIPDVYGVCEVIAQLDDDTLSARTRIYINEGSQQSELTAIELRVSHNLIRGFIGEMRTEQLTAIARNIAGVGIPGVRISLGISDPQMYKGTVSVPDSVTDENGQITATYHVVLERNIDVEIYAHSGQISGTKIIQLQIIDIPFFILLDVNRSVLIVPRDQTRSTSVNAVLVDTVGLALPDIEVRLRADPPTHGWLDSDSEITDNSGRITCTFTSIVNRYGICEVSATAGDSTSKARIEIRE